MSMRDCPFNHELLTAYATGNVEAHERAVVERHLAQCPVCRREVVLLEKTWWVLDSWQEDLRNPAPRVDDLRMKIARSKHSQPLWMRYLEAHRRWFIFRPAPVTALAGIMATFLLFLWVQPFLVHENQKTPLSPPVNGGKNQIALKSGNLGAKDPLEVVREDRFMEALQKSERDKRNSDSSVYLTQGGQLQLTRMGNVPNGNVISVNETEITRPVPMMYQGEPIRMGR